MLCRKNVGRLDRKFFYRTLSLCLTLLVIFVFLRPNATKADDTPLPQRIFTIPYTPLPGWQVPLVSVRLDRKIVCTFLVDTGSNGDLLTDVLVRQLKLVPQPAIKNGRPYLFNGEASRYVLASSYEVGTLTISQPHFLVVERKRLLSALGQSPLSQPVDGLISSDNLSRFSVFFDCPNRRIALWYPSGLADADIRKAGFDPSHPVPLTTPPDDVLYSLTAHFQNGKEEGDEKLLLDTGASFTAISSSLARKLKLTPDPKDVTTQLLSGSFSVRKARVPLLTIGNLTAKNVEVVYPSDPKDNKPTVLGMGFLSQYRFLIDYHSSRLFLAEGRAIEAGSVNAENSHVSN